MGRTVPGAARWPIGFHVCIQEQGRGRVVVGYVCGGKWGVRGDVGGVMFLKTILLKTFMGGG